jgi:Tfp pilus assembly protein PilX
VIARSGNRYIGFGFSFHAALPITRWMYCGLCSGGSPIRRRVSAESGIALVMALGILIVLSIVGVTMVSYATSNEKSTRYSTATVAAQSLAEAGVNNAISVLESAINPSDPDTLPGAASPTVDTSLTAGTVSWWGSYDDASSTWTVKGQGAVRNPAATGTITRIASVKVAITYSPLWQYWYSDGGDGCTTFTNNVVLSPKLYVHGPLCIDKNVVINSSSLQVDGTLTMLNAASVGTSGAPINQANIAGGCARVTGGPYTTPCSSAQKVYANTITTNSGTLAKPAVNLAYWYQNAHPGPMHNCTTGSVPGGFDTDTTLNRSLPTFTLTPATSYSCTYSTGGQLSWNASTKILTVSGAIFFDGNISMTSGTYQGRGTIFSSGTIAMTGASPKFCGVSTCDASWDPTTNLIVFVAGSSTDQYGFTLQNNQVYQAATYVVDDYQQLNNAENWGPVMARSLYVQNNSTPSIPVNAFPGGTPGAIVTIVPGSWTGS